MIRRVPRAVTDAAVNYIYMLKLVEAAEMRASSTWDERTKAFRHYHQIYLGTLARWSELDAAIEIRNAVAHGLGQITPRQRQDKARAKMVQFGVSVRDGHLKITEASLQKCRDVCVAYVLDLDATLPVLNVR